MHLTYIFHSCFMLETETCILIFDFWKDSPDGTVARTLEHTSKRVYFLASHFHEDHFNPEILSMSVPNGQRRIILSRDIIRRRRAKEADADAILRRGDGYTDDMVSVKAFGSTDSGVSFMVETDGKKVFHAGDLNNWHWEDESTPKEVKKMEGDFKAVLRDIRTEYPAVDLVMFPVDPRLGTDFARGARQWLETIRTTYLAPMHFPPAREKAMTFGKEAEQLGTRFLYIHREGELIATL